MALIPGISLAATAGTTITVSTNAGKPVFSPDGSTAYVVGTTTGQVVAIDVASASASPLPNTIPGSNGGAGWGLGISPDGRRLYATGFDANTLSVLRADTGAAIGSPITVGNRPGALAVSPDGSMVFIANWSSNDISFVDGDVAGASVVRTGTSAQARDLVVSPDGLHLYAAVSGTELLQIKISDGSIVRRITTGGDPTAVAITPDGTTLIVANESTDDVTFIRTSDWSTSQLAVGDEPYGVAITPNGRTAYISNHRAGTISVVDLASRTVTDVVVAGPNPWQSAVSPLGTRLYVGRMSGPQVFTFEIEGGGSGGDSGGSGVGTEGSGPRVAMQQFAVPSGTTSDRCAALVPKHVDWLGLEGHREVGWGLSYAEWPNEGQGGFVCGRDVRWTGTTWVIS